MLEARWTQNPAPARACRFDSDLRHHSSNPALITHRTSAVRSSQSLPLAQLRPHERRSAGPRPSYWGRAAMSDRRPTPPYSTRAGGSIHPSPARPWRHGHPWRGGAVRITGGYPDGSLGSGRRGNLGRPDGLPKDGDRAHDPTGRLSGVADTSLGDQPAVGRPGISDQRNRAGLWRAA